MAVRPTPVGEEGPRHQARERALSLLYEAELKGVAPETVLASLPAPPDPFAVVLVAGVGVHRARIDALLEQASVGWELSRMPVVDRTLLRIATYELLEQPEIPVAVVIDEAVELAKQYSTEESGKFVNGMLTTVALVARSTSA
jgi:N utilization substance protein B